ncbi:M12 family metallopeptidase [Gelidibacter salicanalis]|uniref:Peptidase metallopeptidase domain-containing protein n=1 Tax=Gelidibacter salicanalis TaxID=291193 RepID=A0A934KP86_9FLAO|nr:M12 family metallopeptidase [Gelidibacter salicanalis]MBJ7882966.1 hypothetical protein [Gelidibacter salicanalis]
MKTNYNILLCVVLLTSACKDNTAEKIEINDEIATDSIAIRNFCTQMPLYDMTDAFLYSFEKEQQSINGGFERISTEDFNEWKESSPLVSIEFNKVDTLKALFGSPIKENALEYFYQIDAAIVHNSVWPYNQLKVKFINGSKALQDRVMSHAVEWEKWCAVKFERVASESADITISFSDEGFWSHVGKQSVNYSPSMSLTGIENESAARFRGTVLHEFGHALGLVHEHQNPNSELVWNEPAVFDYYARTQGWNEEETYENVIYRYNFGAYNHEDATKFDPTSVMIYEIPSWMLKNSSGIGFKENDELSDLDKQLIKTKYY